MQGVLSYFVASSVFFAMWNMKYVKTLGLIVLLCGQELTKFINQCNETKAATFATKDGGQLCILKKPESSSKKSESSSGASK